MLFAVEAVILVVGDQTTESVAAKPVSVNVLSFPGQIAPPPVMVAVGNSST